jgi:beta-glucosidase
MKNKNRLTLLVIFLLSIVDVFAQKQSMHEYVDALMLKMTLQEKIGQLNLQDVGAFVTGLGIKNNNVAERISQGKIGGVLNVRGVDKIKILQDIAVKKSRLGIPLLTGLDVIHGYETIFPIPLAQSCSWNLDKIRQGARIAAIEASADGICWTFSPMVDICIDPRWGRVAEGNGEDSYLGSQIAKAMVQGYQGHYSRADNIMACVKHFALYGASEAGRDYNTVDMSRWRMYNQYLPPYKAAAQVGAGSFMSSFNVVDGIPATGNRWLLTDLLRHQWNFGGFVVTDYGAIREMMAHGMGNIKTVTNLALNAGTDMDMCSEAFLGYIETCLKEGKVTMTEIDMACRRILEAKYKLGLFSNPYKYCNTKQRSKVMFTAEHRAAARDLAAETFVLLKNQDHLLPLRKEGKIALIGPLGDRKSEMSGCWSPTAVHEKYSSLREALERTASGKVKVLYAQGCNILSDSIKQKDAEFNRPFVWGNVAMMEQEALDIAKEADIIICAMGECAEMTGECASMANIELPDVQQKLLAKLVKIGKPIVLLNFSGRPTVMTWEVKHIPAILNVWFGGSEAADAICDVIFGDKVPSGKLTTTFPQSIGQVPIYYNHLNTGRPVDENDRKFAKFKSNYLDISNEPLFPFGYGLSYTTFKYSEVRLSSDKMNIDSSVTASVTVTNTGNYDADEIVQLYIRDKVGSVSRPIKELKGFRRIHLNKGESKEVKFDIDKTILSFYNANLDYVVEPGEFEIMIGPNSNEVSRANLTVE